MNAGVCDLASMWLEDVAPACSFPTLYMLATLHKPPHAARTAILQHNIAASIDTNRPVKPTRAHTDSARYDLESARRSTRPLLQGAVPARQLANSLFSSDRFQTRYGLNRKQGPKANKRYQRHMSTVRENLLT